MSKNAAMQYCLVSSAFLKLLYILWTCSIDECCFLNPNWWSGINFCELRIGFNLDKNSFSSILESTAKRLIGLYDVTCCNGLPWFGITCISATFYYLGNEFILKMEFFSFFTPIGSIGPQEVSSIGYDSVLFILSHPMWCWHLLTRSALTFSRFVWVGRVLCHSSAIWWFPERLASPAPLYALD